MPSNNICGLLLQSLDQCVPCQRKEKNKQKQPITLEKEDLQNLPETFCKTHKKIEVTLSGKLIVKTSL
jgi:hypothetical protein